MRSMEYCFTSFTKPAYWVYNRRYRRKMFFRRFPPVDCVCASLYGSGKVIISLIIPRYWIEEGIITFNESTQPQLLLKLFFSVCIYIYRDLKKNCFPFFIYLNKRIICERIFEFYIFLCLTHMCIHIYLRRQYQSSRSRNTLTSNKSNERRIKIIVRELVFSNKILPVILCSNFLRALFSNTYIFIYAYSKKWDRWTVTL